MLEKYGKPDDVMPGFQGKKFPLPSHPLSGMYNKSGGKVRLTFKLELDQLWIGTKGGLLFSYYNFWFIYEFFFFHNSQKL